VASPFWGRVEASTNLEVKAVDGSANPYLALGALVAAGLDGIQRGLDPGEPLLCNPDDLSEAEREARGIRRYPSSLAEAVDALEQDTLLIETLGEARAHEFIAVRRAEWHDLGTARPDRVHAVHFARY
jgi:glutamine synthetase